jgi:hypothetical protein
MILFGIAVEHNFKLGYRFSPQTPLTLEKKVHKVSEAVVQKDRVPLSLLQKQLKQI